VSPAAVRLETTPATVLPLPYSSKLVSAILLDCWVLFVLCYNCWLILTMRLLCSTLLISGSLFPFIAIVTTTKLKTDAYWSVLVPWTSPLVAFVVFRAVSVMSSTTFFLDVTQSNLVDTYQLLRGIGCLHTSTLKMAVKVSLRISYGISLYASSAVSFVPWNIA
jgi:membrane protein implicated in regulation of membrane protease activity